MMSGIPATDTHGLSTGLLLHGGLRVDKLTRWFRVPKASVPREQGRRCKDFFGLASDVMQYDFCYTYFIGHIRPVLIHCESGLHKGENIRMWGPLGDHLGGWLQQPPSIQFPKAN